MTAISHKQNEGIISIVIQMKIHHISSRSALWELSTS